MPVDAKTFKDALSRFPSGVTVVTLKDGEEVHGITVSAFISVSLEPPLILVSIDKRSKLHDTFGRLGRFAVSILRNDQSAVSNYYAGWRQPGQTVDLAHTPNGHPVVAGAIAWIECALEESIESGDHTLFIGLVENASTHDGEPLLYFRGKYGEFHRTAT